MKGKANFSFDVCYFFFDFFTRSLPLSVGVNGPLEMINPHGNGISRIPRLLILLGRTKLCYVTRCDWKGLPRRNWNFLWRGMVFFLFRFLPVFWKLRSSTDTGKMTLTDFEDIRTRRIHTENYSSFSSEYNTRPYEWILQSDKLIFTSLRQLEMLWIAYTIFARWFSSM